MLAVTPGPAPDADARTHRDDPRFVGQTVTNGEANGHAEQAQAHGEDIDMPE